MRRRKSMPLLRIPAAILEGILWTAAGTALCAAVLPVLGLMPASVMHVTAHVLWCIGSFMAGRRAGYACRRRRDVPGAALRHVPVGGSFFVKDRGAVSAAARQRCHRRCDRREHAAQGHARFSLSHPPAQAWQKAAGERSCKKKMKKILAICGEICYNKRKEVESP